MFHANLPQCKPHRNEQKLQGQELCTDWEAATGKHTIRKRHVGAQWSYDSEFFKKTDDKMEYKYKTKSGSGLVQWSP
jgi:hypothetical protein